ncbi:hypothetical protein ACQJBY_073549 [Aegilops geniculata]
MLAEALGCGFVEADDNHSRANKGEHSGKEHLAELQEMDAPNLNNLVEKGRHAEVYNGQLADGQFVAVKRLTKILNLRDAAGETTSGTLAA